MARSNLATQAASGQTRKTRAQLWTAPDNHSLAGYSRRDYMPYRSVLYLTDNQFLLG